MAQNGPPDPTNTTLKKLLIVVAILEATYLLLCIVSMMALQPTLLPEPTALTGLPPLIRALAELPRAASRANRSQG